MNDNLLWCTHRFPFLALNSHSMLLHDSLDLSAPVGNGEIAVPFVACGHTAGVANELEGCRSTAGWRGGLNNIEEILRNSQAESEREGGG